MNLEEKVLKLEKQVQSMKYHIKLLCDLVHITLGILIEAEIDVEEITEIMDVTPKFDKALEITRKVAAGKL